MLLLHLHLAATRTRNAVIGTLSANTLETIVHRSLHRLVAAHMFLSFCVTLTSSGKPKSTTKTAPSLASQTLRLHVLVLSDKRGAHLTLLSVVSVPPTRRTVELPILALLAYVQSGFSSGRLEIFKLNHVALATRRRGKGSTTNK
ncbi:hypothetical protein DY000_02051493 [Brassica cretica]|uniref:Secreted protein n=1 Tax=Brassica cretica TaxID=69181 RepID=A0ABQ7EPN3_BRACR|nr:hypothetical protein DY000_02051493 [Brassica cretica]